MVVNFFHYQSYWFYFLSDEIVKKFWKPYNRIDWDNFPEVNTDCPYRLLSKDCITKKEAARMIKEMYPDAELHLSLFYHQGPKHFGKNGSRPYDNFVTKKDMRKYGKQIQY